MLFNSGCALRVFAFGKACLQDSFLCEAFPKTAPSTHSLLPRVTHLFNKFLSGCPHVPGTVLGTEDARVNETDINLCPHGAHSLVGERDKKTTSKPCRIEQWNFCTPCIFIPPCCPYFPFPCALVTLWGFPGGASGKEPACQCRRHTKTWV